MAAGEEFPGIPAARFISDVSGALEGRDPGALLQELQAQYQNYKMLEQRLMQARQRMQTKVCARAGAPGPPSPPPPPHPRKICSWGTEGGRIPFRLGGRGGWGGLTAVSSTSAPRPDRAPAAPPTLRTCSPRPPCDAPEVISQIRRDHGLEAPHRTRSDLGLTPPLPLPPPHPLG